MTRTRFRVASAVFLITASLVAGACNDEEDDDLNRRARSAADANARSSIPKTVTPDPAATPLTTATSGVLPPKEYRYATAAPVAAAFNQPAFTTTYTLVLTGPFPQGGVVRWSGPNCGTVAGDRHIIGPDYRLDNYVEASTFTWVHPHPPCANTTDHSDVTVVATLTEGSGRPGETPLVTTVCTYKGSASGAGPACQIQR